MSRRAFILAVVGAASALIIAVAGGLIAYGRLQQKVDGGFERIDERLDFLEDAAADNAKAVQRVSDEGYRMNADLAAVGAKVDLITEGAR